MCFHSKNNLKFRFFFLCISSKNQNYKIYNFFYNAVKSEKLYDGGKKILKSSACVS